MHLLNSQVALLLATFVGVVNGQCESSWIGDGVCDNVNNNIDCDWDGGDCCECTCLLANALCGRFGFDDCQQPGLPCSPEENSMCGGVPGVRGTSAEGIPVCCAPGCSQCGRSRCGSRGLGVDECCTSRIVDTGIECGEGVDPPCILVEDEEEDPIPMCADGIPGVTGTAADGTEVCCDPGCTQCGGSRCGSTSPGLGADECCTSRIVDAGEVCGDAPCILPGDEEQSTCSNGLPGLDGLSAEGIVVCCDPSCGQCGGSGCARFGASECCTSRIVDSGLVCGQNAGAVVAPCMIAVECDDDDECNDDQICCPTKKVCESPIDIDPTACGDPHMTGYRGQKFDFTGTDGKWYALFSSPPAMHINMRVSTPLPEVPIITYITGLSLITTDSDGLAHSIIIKVKDPSSLDSSCPAGVSPCLAEGALTVLLDEEEALTSPGVVEMAPGVVVSAVNLPGSCRSFGFEKYWERKQLEYKQLGRRLDGSSQTMAEWILEDPTATNPDECAEYVAHALSSGSATAGNDGGVDESGLFAHQSEHASFKIVTPAATIRLTHGKLHQVAMRDPTDTMDLPDHVTWQMNLAIDSKTYDSIVSRDGTVVPAAKGILGETAVPTIDEDGEPIMEGMESIRGTTEQYRVEGPLGVEFDMDHQW